jgi:uncharacterized protein CbrC (UPF0167 family)
MMKVDHVNTMEAPLPCVLCQQGTTYRAVWKPTILPFELRKAVCPGCIQDFLSTARFAGRVLGSIETNTNMRKSGDPDDKE